jgi:glycosyltransferase involved in cell wall biosynthesis
MEHALFQGAGEVMDDVFRLSVAIPLWNEESALPELLQRLSFVLDHLPGGPHEIVFVDDGSSDRTLALLEEATVRDPRIMVISLSRNFGHQAALSAALDNVTGDAVILMDGDLQDAPESIPIFLEKFNEGFDVVYAQRIKRKEPWWLRLCYHVFYRFLSSVAETHLPLDAGDFGLMSRRVIDQLRRMPERNRYLRGLRSWVGYRQIGIAVEREERHSGHTKYTPWRLLRLAADGIFAFSTVPLRAATVLGMFSVGLSGLFALYSLFVKIFLVQSPRGFTALTLLITSLVGFNLLFIGIVGEYVGRIYEEVKARPHYIVEKIIRGSRVQDNSRDRVSAQSTSQRGS